MVIPLNCKILFHQFPLNLQECNLTNLKFIVLINIKDIFKCKNKIHQFCQGCHSFFL